VTRTLSIARGNDPQRRRAVIAHHVLEVAHGADALVCIDPDAQAEAVGKLLHGLERPPVARDRTPIADSGGGANRARAMWLRSMSDSRSVRPWGCILAGP
jgi:hypothetical protein